MTARDFLIVLSITASPFLGFAQSDKKAENLVPNGSFEDMDGKPKRLGNIEMARGWKSPNTVTADLFTESVSGAPVSAPRNQFGDQSALTGTNYAGVRWWSFGAKEPRSYLQAKLTSSLTKDQKYCVKYFVSLADLSKYATAEHGAYITKQNIYKKDEASLTFAPQVPLVREKVRDDMHAWQGVCGVYEALGGEQFIIIGNFAANEKTANVKVKRPKGDSRPQLMNAYYFIDDVSVSPIEKASECSCEQLDKAESEHIFSRRGSVNPNAKPGDKADQMVFYFKRFQRGIDGSMESWIDELVSYMKADPALRIKLVGHIDSVEKDRIRMRPDLEELAKERADTVKEAIVEGGVDASRITTVGVGGDSPADDAETEVAMSKNRRVEVELIK